jgi:agmatine deiminase
MNKKFLAVIVLVIAVTLATVLSRDTEESKLETRPLDNSSVLYTMPEESEPHEGTWLQWPHEHQYGTEYRNSLDPTWVAMTKALVTSEKVYIVVYNPEEQSRITELLNSGGVPLQNIEFKIYKNDDVWMRDNGPIYVRDKSGKLVIQDWGFNGWGGKEGYKDSDAVPTMVAKDQGLELVDLNKVMNNEGGAVEIDGNGTLMTTRSATLNDNRNPGMSQSRAEEIFNKYLGVTNFIWLDGKAGLEVTDMHIDGFARFGNKNTIVTMSNESLQEWQVPDKDIEILSRAANKDTTPYNRVILPLTQQNATTEAGKDLGYKGSYVNYYIANTVVLVPNYNDPNDTIANDIIQKLYPDRKVVGIDVRNLYENGGMVHCVTQQQPKM